MQIIADAALCLYLENSEVNGPLLGSVSTKRSCKGSNCTRLPTSWTVLSLWVLELVRNAHCFAPGLDAYMLKLQLKIPTRRCTFGQARSLGDLSIKMKLTAHSFEGYGTKATLA